MNLEAILVAVSCLTDDTLRMMLHDVRLRQRGPAPRRVDSELVTMRRYEHTSWPRWLENTRRRIDRTVLAQRVER